VKAFLSHSSKDKQFVREVAKNLGNLQIEYDEYTFEYVLNAEAIRRALARSDLFVLFLSENSINSSFVKEEILATLEARARGQIKQVLIFAIDNTSYRSLPVWLREINVVQHMGNEKACARKIQATLISLDTETTGRAETYLGREEDEKDLRKALAAAPGIAPVALHAVGHFGIGRKTFLRQTLGKLYPRDYQVFVEIPLQAFEGPEELYRRLYDLHFVSSLEQKTNDFAAFANLPQSEQNEKLADILTELSQNGEFVLIDDQNGVYTDEGYYHPYMEALIKLVVGSPKPVIGFVQSRMMPFAAREKHRGSYHRFLKTLSDESIKELLSFSLKEAQIDFTQEQLDELAEFLDGHPFNVRFATKAIKNYGLASFLADPRDLVEWKLRRAEDFLRLIKLDNLECELVAAMSEYRFLPLEMFKTILEGEEIETIARALRNLEDFCLVERRGDYFQVSAPVRDAVRRDKRFDRDDKWKQKLAGSIAQTLQDYKNEDHVPVALLESGVLASIRGAKVPNFVAALVLPSHLLTVARSFYDKKQYKACVDFCRRAYDLQARLTLDARVEVLRLWGLSLARIGDTVDLEKILTDLRAIDTRTARRNMLFLEGFRLRLRNDFEGAEEEFIGCWNLGRDNQSVNRELASLLCKQRRYSEAEGYARSAYRIAPTNPFIIDILAEILLGQAASGLRIDYSELERLLNELRVYGDAPGSSFFLIRQAQAFARERKIPQALRAVEKAIERTPNLLSPYFIRAEILMSLSDIPGVERDLHEIDALLEKSGATSEGDEIKLHELQAKVLVEKRQFRQAMTKIDNSIFLTKPMKRRLLTQLAKTIQVGGEGITDRQMITWAQKYAP
jgi:tetratricopeptide (TPR) repeat protein